MVIDKIPQSSLSNTNKLSDLLKIFPNDDSELGTALFEEVTDPTKVALGDPISPLYIGKLRVTEALDEPTINLGKSGREVAIRKETGPALQFKSGPSISKTKMPS